MLAITYVGTTQQSFDYPSMVVEIFWAIMGMGKRDGMPNSGTVVGVKIKMPQGVCGAATQTMGR